MNDSPRFTSPSSLHLTAIRMGVATGTMFAAMFGASVNGAVLQDDHHPLRQASAPEPARSSVAAQRFDLGYLQVEAETCGLLTGEQQRQLHLAKPRQQPSTRNLANWLFNWRQQLHRQTNSAHRTTVHCYYSVY